MAKEFEIDPKSYYSKLMMQIDQDIHASRELTELFLRIRKKCSGELKQMQKLVDVLSPTPNFFVYSGGTVQITPTYYCHSELHTSLAKAMIKMLEGRSEGPFSADANNQIVLADVNAKIPFVSKYTAVIESTSIIKLEKNHPAVKLYSHAYNALSLMQQKGQGSTEFAFLLLAEGFKEKVVDIKTILPKLSH